MSDTILVTPFTPFIHLVFSQPIYPMPDLPHLKKSIISVNPSAKDDEIGLHWAESGSRQGSGRITFGKHTIQIASVPAPLPKTVIDRTIHVAPWSAQTRAALRQHRAHLSLVYDGDQMDPVEQMIALYTLAHALENEDLLGIVNEQAWTAHPSADYLQPESIRSYRDTLPLHLWVGKVKFYLDDERYWLVTKGHHIFDVPDLAILLGSDSSEQAVREQFASLFYYLYENDREVLAGDTVEFQATGQTFRFGEVTELADLLLGPSGTLVIEQETNC